MLWWRCLILVICESCKWREGKWPERWIASKVKLTSVLWHIGKRMTFKKYVVETGCVRILSVIKTVDESLKVQWWQLCKFTKTSLIFCWARIKVQQHIRIIGYEVRVFMSSWEVAGSGSAQHTEGFEDMWTQTCTVQVDTFHYSALLYAQKIALC